MYMERIVAAPAVAKPAATPALRALVGVPILLLSLLLMVPWLAGVALFAIVALVLRALVEMVNYAGTVALGR